MTTDQKEMGKNVDVQICPFSIAPCFCIKSDISEIVNLQIWELSAKNTALFPVVVWLFVVSRHA